MVDAAPPPKKPLVVLVHGILTWAPWYTRIRETLSSEFEVEPTSFGFFHLLKFLVPFSYFRTRAAEEVERDIWEAMNKHQVQEISVIAHSFGTFVIGWLLQNRPRIQFKHIIICGSILPRTFPFQFLDAGRFQSCVNEVGTRDYWPIVAESVTWGYGSTGAFGFNRPGIYDRFHHGMSHSDFFTEEFCKKWWVPILRGDRPLAAGVQERPPWWLRFAPWVPIKYLLAVLLAVLLWSHADVPDRDFMLANIEMNCRPGPHTPKGAGTAGVSASNVVSVLVLISADDDQYIRDVKTFLEKMQGVKVHFVEHSTLDPNYNVITEYKDHDSLGQSDVDLGKDENWLAYSVDTQPGKTIIAPVPTKYKLTHRTTFLLSTVSKPDPKTDTLAWINQSASGLPTNTDRMHPIVARITPYTGRPDRTRINFTLFGDERCWN
jgi:pimeloyl-ACP methyl ester carboxylesterase